MSTKITQGISKESKMTPYDSKMKPKTIASVNRSVCIRAIQFLTRIIDINHLVILVRVNPDVANVIATFFPHIGFLSYGFKNTDTQKEANLNVIEAGYDINQGDWIIKNNPGKEISILDFRMPSNDQLETRYDEIMKEIQILNPYSVSALIKLPYPSEKLENVKFYEGEFFWVCWGGINSSHTFFSWYRNRETKLGEWNLKEYEQLTAYHNYVERINNTFPEIPGGKEVGLTRDFDSALEFKVLKDFTQLPDEKVVLLSKFISSSLGNNSDIFLLRK